MLYSDSHLFLKTNFERTFLSNINHVINLNTKVEMTIHLRRKGNTYRG